jgi:hypothetical protein
MIASGRVRCSRPDCIPLRITATGAPVRLFVSGYLIHLTD